MRYRGNVAARSFVTLLTLWLAAPLNAAESSPAPGKPFDLQRFLDQAIGAGSQRIVVPPGRYRVTPRHGRHLAFKNLANRQIVADGVEMICTQTCRAIDIEDCINVHLVGLTIDYDPLPMTEGRITALAPDKAWLEFEIFSGYPTENLASRIEIYDPATRELRRTDASWSETFTRIGDRRYRVAKRPGYRFRGEYDTEQVGDILVTIHQSPMGATGHAVIVERSTDVTLEGITLYSAPTFGFVEHQCDGTTYRRCRIDRRPAESDLVPRGFPRMRSLTADAFHSVGAARGSKILQCTAKFQGDDCVNIHGTYHLVTASAGNVLRAATVRTMTIERGDPVEFLPYEGRRPADAVATKIEPDEPIRPEEIAFIRKLNLLPRHKEILLEGRAKFFRITLDRPVALPMGSAVCSGNRVGNGFAVKDCDFGYNRSRAILIKASRGEISGNRITHGWMAAVLVSPEFWWFESASSSDLVIRDNTIVGCRRPAIEVVAPGGNGKPLPSGAHRNISILDNRIRDSVWPNIRVTSTQGLVVRGNQLTPRDPEQMIPPQPDRWKWAGAEPRPIVTEFCEDVQIQP